jgi:hypothetical protein
MTVDSGAGAAPLVVFAGFVVETDRPNPDLPQRRIGGGDQPLGAGIVDQG